MKMHVPTKTPGMVAKPADYNSAAQPTETLATTSVADIPAQMDAAARFGHHLEEFDILPEQAGVVAQAAPQAPPGDAPIQAKGKSKSWKRRRAARLAEAERQRQEARVAAATRIQAAFRGHLARRQARLTREMLDPQNRSQGNFQIKRTFGSNETNQALANRTLYRRHGDNDPEDQRDRRRYTSYVQYDERGGPIRRVDITGAAHGGVPTPHVLEYTRHERETPNGVLHQYGTPEGNAVRPAHYWEVPPYYEGPPEKPKKDKL